METNKILDADLLDILFDGKNKEYGAYDIRKTYNRRLVKALLGTGALILFLCGGYFLSRLRAESVTWVQPVDVDPHLTTVEVHPKKEEPVMLPRVARPVVAQAPTMRDVTVRIVHDQDVKPNERPPENSTLDNVRIGLTNNLAATGDPSAVAPPEGKGNGVVSTPVQTEDADGIFIKVEKESEYPGGMQAWQRFLIKNCRVPDDAVSNNVSGMVTVQFIVDREGNVSEVHAISGPTEGGLREEAERVIRKSGKWTPALQNGKFVKSYKRQPIVFEVGDGQ